MTIWKTRRKELGMTLKQVSEKLVNKYGDPLSPSFLSYVENGHRLPSSELQKQLEQILGLTDDARATG